jgi:phytoene dehydrogenase-like protein
MSKPVDVVVVGAGLAGLTATRGLAKAGLNVKLIDCADRVGGRIKTDLVSGFRLDHGFQLFNPAYPAARKVLNISELELRKFRKGIRIVLDEEIVEFGRNPSDSWHFLQQFDKTALLNFAKYLVTTVALTAEARKSRANVSAKKALLGACEDDDLVEDLLTPFLAGVFLEADLDVSRHWLDEVLRYFVLGSPGVPRYGMQEIPTQLTRGVSDFIQLNTMATKVNSNSVETSHGVISAKNVVIATDPSTTAMLLDLPAPKMREVTTWYFSIKHRNRGPRTKLLAVDGSSNPGPLVNSVVLTDVARSYAPAGYDLIASSALGLQDELDLSAIKTHTALLNTLNPADLELIATYQIPAALPQTNYDVKAIKNLATTGIFVASDLITSPSINGAIESGQQVADQILLKKLAEGN